MGEGLGLARVNTTNDVKEKRTCRVFLRVRRISAEERQRRGKKRRKFENATATFSRRRSSSRRKLLNSVELSPKKLARMEDNASRRETEKVRTGCLSVNYSERNCLLVNCLRLRRLPRRSLIVGWNSSLNRNSDRSV